MKNSLTTYQAINLLTAKSACYQGVSSSFQRQRQTKQKLSNNCCEILISSQGGWYSYIFITGKTEQHPFHVKSTWISQVQHSVALESYLENVKTQLAEFKIIKPKNNLSRNEVKALKELKNNPAINLQKNKQRDNNSNHERGRQNIRGQGATR